MEDLVLLKNESCIAYITLNRPEKRNAMDDNMVTALKEKLSLASQDSQVKVIVLRANGKAFCAGADLAYLKKLQGNSFDENLADSQHLKSLFQLIYTLPKPVIAQVQGHAIAGGSGLVCVCDFSFSIPEAKFGFTEVRIGFVPAIVMVFLLRKIGESTGKELLLGGELITAKYASEIRMINGVVEATKIEDHVKDFAQTLCDSNSSQSMELTKEMIANVQSMPFGDALDYAANMNAKARSTDDCKKGIAAFLNKEKPSW